MEESQHTMTDAIAAVKPTMTNAQIEAEAQVVDSVMEPLEVVDVSEPRTKLRLFAIMASLYLVLFIAALDQTIMATSIPTIAAALQSATGYTWIGGAYLLANAATGPIWAKCSDIWGRKPALLTAVCGFAVSSIIAALSTNMRMLIAGRALQGAAGGGLMQMVAITISDLFSVRKRALYFGLLGLMWAVAGATGPLVGGALTQLVSWRWCFWINLPVCGIAFVLLMLFLDVHNPRTKLKEGIKAIDWFGTISILAVTLMLLLGLDFGGATFAWKSPQVICLIAIGLAMIGFFLFCEQRLAKYPLMPLSIFKNWSNNAVIILSIAHTMVSIGAEYYLPLYFQSVKQASPFRSGVLILPMVCTEAATDILIGILMHRTGRYREIIWVGVTLMTLGTGLYIKFGIDTPISEIAGFEIIWGIGTALLFQAPMLALQNTVSQSNTASTTATLGFLKNLAAALSVVLGGVVFQNSMDGQSGILKAAGLDESLLEALSGKQAAANVNLVKTIQDKIQHTIVQGTFAMSIKNIFIMYTGIAGIALVSSIFIKHKSLNTEHSETKTGIQNLTKRK